VLHDAAPSVGTSGVVAQVTRRRTRRRRNRRLGAVALTLVALLVVGTVTVALTRDDHDRSTQVVSPGASLRARIVEGGAAVDTGAGTTRAPTQVVLDQDPHLMRAPVLAGSNGLSIASYEPGVEGVTPSYVVRVEGAHVADVVDLKARVLSIAEGEGARWIVTQNHGLTGGTVPDAFLKRVSGSGTPPSVPLPPNADPVGPVAAVGGAVWVPVRDGVLQFDTTGKYVRKEKLADADHRWVAQVGKFAAVTDGRTLRTLDVSGPNEVTDTYESPIIGLASAGFDSRVLLASDAGTATIRRAAGGATTGATTTLPDGFLATGLAASPSRIWATGTVDGAPAIVLLGDRGVRATVVLENASDGATLAWTDDHTVRAISDGKLYDIAIP
jgi:hypothetical protein